MNKEILNFFHILHQTSHLAQQLAHRDLFASEGITNIQFCILKDLFISGGSLDAVSRLGIAKTCTPANLTGLVSRLQKTWFLIKEKDVNDQRKYRISLTDEGDRLCQRIFAKIQEKSQDVDFASVGVDISALTNQLDKVYTMLSNK